MLHKIRQKVYLDVTCAFEIILLNFFLKFLTKQRNIAQIMLVHDPHQTADGLWNRRASVEQHSTHFALHRRPPRVGPGRANRLPRADPVRPETIRLGVANQPAGSLLQTISGDARAKRLQLQRPHSGRERGRTLLPLLPHVRPPQRLGERVPSRPPRQPEQPPSSAPFRRSRTSPDQSGSKFASFDEVESPATFERSQQQQQFVLRSSGLHPAGSHKQQRTSADTRTTRLRVN